jgi:hypothetical protein
MKFRMFFYLLVCGVCTFFLGGSANAADYPTPVEGDWVVRDFRFHRRIPRVAVALHHRRCAHWRAGIDPHGTTGSGTASHERLRG